MNDGIGITGRKHAKTKGFVAGMNDLYASVTSNNKTIAVTNGWSSRVGSSWLRSCDTIILFLSSFNDNRSAIENVLHLNLRQIY